MPDLKYFLSTLKYFRHLKLPEDAPFQKVPNIHPLGRRWTFRSLSEEQACKILAENIDSRLIARDRWV